MAPSRSHPPSTSLAAGCLLVQLLVISLFLLFILESQVIARTFVSEITWERILSLLGGRLQATPEGPVAEAPFSRLLLLSLCGGLVLNALGAWGISRDGSCSLASAWWPTCMAHAFWCWPLGAWSAGWIVNSLLPSSPLLSLLILTCNLAAAVTLAGWLWEILRQFGSSRDASAAGNLAVGGRQPRVRAWWIVLAGMLAYVIVFVSLNWGLWFNLRIPHGDSAMYEEHLWNVLHGKGFRSYLDQGLFLGEHIQVIHLLLLPLYVFWPSHLLLELAESTALAAGAWPVYLIARRHSGCERAAAYAALAYLLYFPMHYLDIAIDLKTFRPSAFGIPALLYAIDAAEQRRWGRMTAGFLLALASQEDFAIAIAPVGLWLCLENLIQARREPGRDQRSGMIVGALVCLLASLYLLLAVKVAIPWFRGGETVHYARYFQEFGRTPMEIAWNILTRPTLLWTKLLTAGAIAYALDLLVPAGFPYRAWSRLLTGAPLFLLLCLNELAQSTPGPFHHFHAPLIPLVYWATVSGLGSARAGAPVSAVVASQRGLWGLCCALTTCLFFSMSPLGIAFWDPGSSMYWRRLYVPDERARQFAKIPPLIPPTARVASTDFVHPRFTHYERSYDYSKYPRKVADYQEKVPDDTDYIVIDTGHPYSEIHRPEEVREFRTQPGQWELVPVDTGGYYIVLRRTNSPERKRAPAERP